MATVNPHTPGPKAPTVAPSSLCFENQNHSNNATGVENKDESLQGPHNWRKSLKPVRSPVQENKEFMKDDNQLQVQGFEERADSPVEKFVKDKRIGKDEKLEESKIRERLKAMPAWKKDFVEKKTKGPMVAKPSCVHTGNTSSASSTSSVQSGAGTPASQRRRLNSSNAESAFTRQVVNRPGSPGLPRKRTSPTPPKVGLTNWEKKASSYTGIGPSGRRTPSPNNGDVINLSAEAAKKRVEKVQKARLYLLQQMGPNSFLIGGDSPDHKFRVIIGPQTCSCGRGAHCVHVLFVMLRVFQVPETEPCLWSKTLKNYEVESLFRTYHARRTSRITDLSKKKATKQKTETEHVSVTDDSTSNGGDTEENSKDEEDTCPICLLEMVEGESLLECENGCQNKLHHHCIAVWFEECRRQNEPLICPLCRAEWKMEEESAETASHEELPVPPNSRASSPQNVPRENDLFLPHAEPIPPELMDTARPWIAVLGEEIVSCLLSRNWVVRETALRHLGRAAIGSLLLGVGEGRNGVMLSPSRQVATHQMLEACCSVLAVMAADPVYKVYVASLRTLRTILSYTPCRDVAQQERLQSLLKPLINTILLKCADANRRTAQLSVSTLLELKKGQNGELAIGREIAHPGHSDLGGVSFLVDCIIQDFDAQSVQWQWLLGRLCMLDKLVEESPTEFVIKQHGDMEGDVGALTNYNRAMSVLKFALKGINNSHIRIGKMARRVFFLTARLQVHQPNVYRQVVEMLSTLNTSLQVRMKRRLLAAADEFHVAQQVAWFVNQGDGIEQTEDSSGALAPCSTPIPSPCSTTPNTSPPSSPQVTVMINNFIGQNITVLPAVPPNSPERHARSSSTSSQFADTESVSSSCTTSTVPSGIDHVDITVITPPSTPKQAAKHKKKSGTHPHKDNKNSKLADDEIPAEVIQVQLSPSLQVRGLRPDSSVADSEQKCEGAKKVVEPEKAATLHCTERPTTFQEEPAYAKKSLSGESSSHADSGCLPSPSGQSSGCATRGTNSTVMLTDDLSDFTLSPTTSEDNPVSFKSEVATWTPEQSPKRRPPAFPSSQQGEGQEEPCPCKEEVELEEAKALVAALERSTAQNSLPFVPGLSPSKEAGDKTLTIHIQDENGTGDKNSSTTSTYMESYQWRRGPVLGTGAFSTCYQARDIKTGTLMCVKQISVCRNSLSEQEKVVEAVQEEIQMMAKLNHSNIVRILGATQQGCHFFMFTEWMPGGSVSYLLDMFGPFTEAVMSSYTQQVLRGLAHLHENNILHRDLKGANLLVDSTGQRVRIGDFGAAARLASRQTGAGEFQGQLLGTIAFMAPEVLRGDNYGRSCDVWSVGCTMIEMATTKPPWGAHDLSNHLALIFKIASSEHPPPIPENLSPPVRDLMLRCLEPSRDDRPPAKELLKHPLFTMCAKK